MNAITIDIGVRIDLGTLTGNLSREQVAAIMAGVAQVVAAQGKAQ